MLRLLLTLLVLSLSVCGQAWPKVYDSQANTWISWNQMIENVQEDQVIYVGELHDHLWGHKVEADLLKSFYSKNANVAVALEMFERDVQFVLDGYLAGQVTSEFFMANSRPWGNYDSGYKDLIEFSKENNLAVVAGNVPRRYAALVAKGKEEFVEAVPSKEKEYLGLPILAIEGKYRDKFYQTMAGHVPPAVIEKYYRSQCLKDDTMAKSICEFLEAKPGHTVISYTGAFHSDEYLGVVEKVQLQMPDLRVSVMSIIPVPAKAEIQPEEYSHKGDYILFAPANEERTSKTPAEQILEKMQALDK